MKTGTLDFYMSQDYPIEIRAVPKELGGGYSASIPFLGRWAFFAVGDTVEEALAELVDVKRELFADMLARKQQIPLAPPSPEDDVVEYSGRILLRIPRDLHRELAKRAEVNGCSINQYAATALAKQLSGERCAEEAAGAVLQSLGNVHLDRDQRSSARYEIETPEIGQFAGDRRYTSETMQISTVKQLQSVDRGAGIAS